jgi:hypothetical protein
MVINPVVRFVRLKENRQHYQANKEAEDERNRQWRQANKEAIIEKNRQHYQTNKGAIKKHRRQWRQAIKGAQPACVYEILNTVNNRAYIGQTTRGEIRWKEHITNLKGNCHENRNLQADFHKYGLEAFEWRVLQEFEIKDGNALLREEAKTMQRFVREGKSLYNLTLTIEQLEMLEQ